MSRVRSSLALSLSLSLSPVLLVYIHTYVAFSRRAKPRQWGKTSRVDYLSRVSSYVRTVTVRAGGELECTTKMQTERRSLFCWLTIALLVGLLVDDTGGVWKRREDKTKCPKVKGIRNFDISEVRGPPWPARDAAGSSSERGGDVREEFDIFI